MKIQFSVKEIVSAVVYIALVGLTCYAAGAFLQWLLDWHEMTPAAAMMTCGIVLASSNVGLFGGIKLAQRRDDER